MASIPESSCEQNLLSALVQAPAHKVLAIKDQLLPTDFTPTGATVFRAVTIVAQDAAQWDDTAVLNLPVVNTMLSREGAFSSRHDTGLTEFMGRLMETHADPLWIPQLAQGLILDSYHRAWDDYQATVADHHPREVGVEESDQAQQKALERLRTARSRIETTKTNQNTRGELHVA